MRRKDREITDFDAVVSIIDECEVIRLGLPDGDFPYVVPLNFGYTASDGRVCFYVHGAMAGRKYELLSKNPSCSFEMDAPLMLDCVEEERSVTTRYRSVMGTCKAEFLEGEAKEWAMDEVIMARYPETRQFDYDKAPLRRTAVIKLTVLKLSAKENPVRVS